MDIKDLRIGNLFLDYAGNVVAVSANIFTDIKSGGWKDAKYMPLTEDVLKQMGFSDKGYKPGFIGIDVKNTDFVLTKPDVESKDVTLNHFSFHLSYGGWPRYKEFEFVHDLQNFFYSFYKEDLKTETIINHFS